MKMEPVVHEVSTMVEIAKEDLAEFTAHVKSKNPPTWIPANYRVTEVTKTTGKPDSEPTMIVKVLLQLIKQTKV